MYNLIAFFKFSSTQKYASYAVKHASEHISGDLAGRMDGRGGDLHNRGGDLVCCTAGRRDDLQGAYELLVVPNELGRRSSNEPMKTGKDKRENDGRY
jgi:hypothetical protein